MSRSPLNLMHSTFFSSLKQAEKRLKVEKPCSTNDPTSVPLSMTESLSSPIYLLQQPKQSSALVPDDSELPREFLSVSHEFSTTQSPEPQPKSPIPVDEPEDEIDDIQIQIQLLMQFLHLSPAGAVSEIKDGFHHDFYSKVVGIEGPKSQREVERLEGWITHFSGNASEPLRLAHLLLAKAAFVSEEEIGVTGLQFPSTIQHFLLTDPPTDSVKINKG